jgi:hypothetical protein
MEEGHGRLGNEAAGPSVLVLFPSRATLGTPIIPNILVQVVSELAGDVGRVTGCAGSWRPGRPAGETYWRETTERAAASY